MRSPVSGMRGIHSLFARCCSSTIQNSAASAPNRRSLCSSTTGKQRTVAIIGGAGHGSSTAFWLSKMAQEQGQDVRIVVIEKDPQYRRCSTALSVGSIRQQFSGEENIRMSLFGAQFLNNIKDYLSVPNEDDPDVNFVHAGYLFLASESGHQVLLENNKVQTKEGANVELLDSDKLKQEFPWLSTEGIVAGSIGRRNEGWFDPYLLLRFLRRGASFGGATFVHGNALSISVRNGRAESVQVELGNRSGQITVNCDDVVLAAGPWSAQVCERSNIESLPVAPRLRSTFIFQSKDEVPGVPLTVCPSGQYFRREGESSTRFITAISPDEANDPDIWTDDTDAPEADSHFWEEVLWPGLAERVPAFEAVKCVGSWGGFYEFNKVDQNGIVGPHTEIPNVMVQTGFSGHGIQQAPAAGRAVAELLLNGSFQTLDLSRLGMHRFKTGDLLIERNVV